MKQKGTSVGGGFFTGRYASLEDKVEPGSRFDPDKFQGKVSVVCSRNMLPEVTTAGKPIRVIATGGQLSCNIAPADSLEIELKVLE